MHLISELPDLGELRCNVVTWATIPEILPHRRPPKKLNKLCEWRMFDCSPWCPQAAIFPFLAVYPFSSFFSDGNASDILDLLGSLVVHGSEITVRYESDHPDLQVERLCESLFLRAL